MVTRGAYVEPQGGDLDRLREMRAGLAREVLDEGDTQEAPEAAAQGDDDAARRMEWLQHLVCLGYLDDAAALGTGHDAAQLQALAFDAVADDLAAAVPSFRGAAALTEELSLRRPGLPPGPAALGAVLALIGVDDGAALPTEALGPHVTIWSRALHWRLATLQLYAGHVAATPGKPAQDGLRSLDALLHSRAGPGDRRWTGRTPEAILDALGAVTGDVPAALRRFTATLGPDPLVFHTGADLDFNRADFDSLMVNRHGAFANHSRVGGFLERFFGDEDLPEPIFRGSPGDRAEHPECRFGLALVQMQLWSLGFYGGRLDGVWGPMSHDALLQLARDWGEHPERFVLHLGDGFYAVNAVAFYKVACAEAESAGREAAHLLAEDPGPDAAMPRETPAQMSMRSRTGLANWIRDALETGRRLALGFASAMRSVGSGLRRGLRRVTRAVGRALGAIGEAAALIYRGVREGLRFLARAARPFAHFVLRLPIATIDEDGRPLVVVKHDFDRDTVAWIAPHALPADMAAHDRLIRRLIRGWDISVSLAIFALTAVSGPIVWLRLGLKLATMLRRLLSDRFGARTA